MDINTMALQMLKGTLTDLSQEEQDKVNECADKLRKIVDEYGEHGVLGISIVGLETAIKSGV